MVTANHYYQGQDMSFYMCLCPYLWHVWINSCDLEWLALSLTAECIALHIISKIIMIN